MQAQAEAQQSQIDELTERIEAVKDELAKTQTLFEEASRDLVRVSTELTYVQEDWTCVKWKGGSGGGEEAVERKGA